MRSDPGADPGSGHRNAQQGPLQVWTKIGIHSHHKTKRFPLCKSLRALRAQELLHTSVQNKIFSNRMWKRKCVWLQITEASVHIFKIHSW